MPSTYRKPGIGGPVDVEPDTASTTAEPLSKKDMKMWLSRIRMAEKFHDLEFKEATERFLKYYQGIFSDEKVKDDRITVNLVFPNTNILMASLYYKDPMILVDPIQKKYEKGASILQHEFPRILKRNKFKKHNTATIFDAVVTGLGWTKTMWNEEKDVPESYHVSPFEILLPPTSKTLLDMDSVPYIIHRFQKPLEEVRENKNYENTGKLTAEKKIKFTPDVSRQGGELDSDVGLVTMYEVHVRDTGEILTFAQNQDITGAKKEKGELSGKTYLEKLRGMKNPDGLPWCRFKPLFFFYVTGKLYPVPLVQIYEAQQLEKNKIRTAMMKHLKRNARRYVATKGTLSLEDAQKFERGEDMSLFEVKAGVESIKPLQDAPMSMDIYNGDAITDRDVDKLTGVTELQRGVQNVKEQTATEAQIINMSSQARQGYMQSIVEDFFTEEAEAQAKLMMKFYDTERMVVLTGIPGWHPFTSKDIDGEYIFSIKIGSSAPHDIRSERMDAIQMLQLSAQIKPLLPQLNLQPLLEQVFEKFDLDNIDTILPPAQPVIPPVPQAQGEMPPGADSGGGNIPPEILAQMQGQV